MVLPRCINRIVSESISLVDPTTHLIYLVSIKLAGGKKLNTRLSSIITKLIKINSFHAFLGFFLKSHHYDSLSF
jgi:hypothetical protein